MLIQGQYQSGSLVFPGSFNPVHDGHLAMADVASRRYAVTVQPEISIANVDKPDIDDADLRRRLARVQRIGIPLVTRAARFLEKAACFPGCRFIIGADTALRLNDPAYANHCPRQRDDCIAKIQRHGCRFVVFGRLIGHTFQDATTLPLCQNLLAICDLVPESDFRIDISSTQLRSTRPDQSPP
ncbi:hypothetical protein [Crateriforma conspicua]|uniref:Nicotinic acid mononucleotide adenylyltransferase n=1 Tax=Crateriforma conspicua TaxID=2527996 RepID=A0A5C6FPQ8_9PLAN|nr:hypothetical protein [Crateriforma conspicua]TWU62413.1 nicotinic acid mononucleotide adenylyltransferase [Crateriforma conspicua]